MHPSCGNAQERFCAAASFLRSAPYVRHPAYGKTVAEMLEEVRENAQKE